MTEEALTQADTAGIRQASNGSRGATSRLLSALGAIDDLDVARPSLLPDWTVGHVPAHLTRNADSS
jgi:maleylpyruvate isomerase